MNSKTRGHNFFPQALGANVFAREIGDFNSHGVKKTEFAFNVFFIFLVKEKNFVFGGCGGARAMFCLHRHSVGIREILFLI